MRVVPSETSTMTAAPVMKVLQDPEATSKCNEDRTCSPWKPYSNSKDFERDAWLIFAILFGLLFFGIGIHAAICCIIRRRQRSLIQANGGGSGGGVVLINSSSSASELNSTEAKPVNIVNGEVLVFNSGYYNKLAVVDCTICLSEFEEGDRVIVLEGCKHGFHVNCIKEWLCFHSSCPICRAATTSSSSSFSGIDLKLY